MRRKDREITDFAEIVQIMEKCDVCRLGLRDGEGVYILPLNFGLRADGSKVELYFHSALEGKKIDLLRANRQVSFEMDCGHALVLMEQKKQCTMNYESVMGKGTIESVPEAEKLSALKLILAHYGREDFAFGTGILPRTFVYKLVVEELTAKRNAKG